MPHESLGSSDDIKPGIRCPCQNERIQLHLCASKSGFSSARLRFSTDAIQADPWRPSGIQITTEAIAKGFDREVSHLQKSFLYMPLIHDETLLSQIAIIALMESQFARCEPESEEAEYWKKSVKFSYNRRDSILRFGRFPSRNEILGRKSTPEEFAYLQKHPSGF